VRSDAIDVLVDLSGHTAGNRLVAFAGRAAPVQATWLGYLNTTGLESMDVRITDGWADPPGLTEAWHTEQLIRLPGSLWCYRPWPESPGVAPPPALSSNRMTFGSANNPAKLNPAVFESWRQILDRVPQSRLLMYAPEDGGLRQRVARMLCREGEPADRVEFFPRLPVAEYLSRYSMMDIALDTFPCAGGTTTLDALWMGVPVVSIAGERPFSRGGASILGNLGFPEWLAGNPLDYVERAVDLASDLGRLQAIRSRLRERMAASALMDAPAFARSMEDVLANLCVPRGTGGTS
jgi:predicted O-linked N-acetylglucosamine transferase (SPINDLY family)